MEKYSITVTPFLGCSNKVERTYSGTLAGFVSTRYGYVYYWWGLEMSHEMMSMNFDGKFYNVTRPRKSERSKQTISQVCTEFARRVTKQILT